MTSPLLIRYPGTSRFYQTPYAPSIANPSGPSASRRYHYHDISPPTSIPTKATLLLLHGFPDFSYGWRNLISPLTMVGYRLIIPDLLGYGASSSPIGNDRLAEYSGLSIVEDLKGLLDYARAGQNSKYGASGKDGKGGRVIVVGHDWGSWLAWKFAQYAPERLMGVSGICVPYPVPHSKYLDMKTVAKLLPNFGYQVFFDDPSSTKKIQDKLELFFSIVYRAPGLFTGIDPNTDPFGTPIEERDSTKWVQEGRLEKLLEKGTLPKEADVGASLLKEDEEMKIYLDQFKDRMEGPLNWYRTRKINYECDRNVLKSPSLPASLPAQLQMADLDSALPLAMGQKTPEHVPSVRIDVLKSCGHWAMVEVPGIVSQNLKRWIDEEVVPSEEKGWLGKIGVKL